MTIKVLCLCGNILHVVTDAFGVYFCSCCKCYREVGDMYRSEEVRRTVDDR
jgi:hypothetical protein